MSVNARQPGTARPAKWIPSSGYPDVAQSSGTGPQQSGFQRGWLLERSRPRNAAYTGERMKSSAHRIIVRKGTLKSLE